MMLMLMQVCRRLVGRIEEGCRHRRTSPHRRACSNRDPRTWLPFCLMWGERERGQIGISWRRWVRIRKDGTRLNQRSLRILVHARVGNHRQETLTALGRPRRPGPDFAAVWGKVIYRVLGAKYKITSPSKKSSTHLFERTAPAVDLLCGLISQGGSLLSLAT